MKKSFYFFLAIYIAIVIFKAFKPKKQNKNIISNFQNENIIKNIIKTNDTSIKNKNIPEFLELKKVPNMGEGLFARTNIKAASSIGEYFGNLINNTDLNKKIKLFPNVQRYAFNVSPDKNIDVTDENGNLFENCYLTKVNEPPKGVMENIIAFRSNNDKIYFITIKDIMPGEQLYISYGKKYERNYETNTNMKYPGWIVKIIDDILIKYPNLIKPEIKFV